ncbi:MAG: hypothetical protein CTY15_04290 [Methylocystis sp.]|nr:MAG: hypothetical protein CTY15_04290 [Methylocystis sp.]
MDRRGRIKEHTAMRLAIAASILLATTLQSPAQQTRDRPSSSEQSQSQRISTQDFVKQAWIIDNFEIQAGRAVQSQAKDAAYKDFAGMIVDDHTRLNDELKNVAGRLQGVELPTKLDREHEQKLQQLTSARDRNIEDTFRTQQIQGHERALKLFQNFAAKTENADLKRLAENAVPILQRHLTQAQELKKTSGVM